MLAKKQVPITDNPASAILDLDRNVTASLRAETFPTQNWGVPLGAA